METKQCKSCGIVKSLDSYYKTERSPDGLFAVCRSCHRERAELWKKNNPNKVKEIQKRYQSKVRTKYYLLQKRKNQENYIAYSNLRKELDTQRKLKRYDGLVGKLRIDQNNSCGLCLKPFTKFNPIDLDHDHTSGLIRGLLCRKCNSGLHYFEDINYVERALTYLKFPPSFKYPPIKY